MQIDPEVAWYFQKLAILKLLSLGGDTIGPPSCLLVYFHATHAGPDGWLTIIVNLQAQSAVSNGISVSVLWNLCSVLLEVCLNSATPCQVRSGKYNSLRKVCSEQSYQLPDPQDPTHNHCPWHGEGPLVALSLQITVFLSTSSSQAINGHQSCLCLLSLTNSPLKASCFSRSIVILELKWQPIQQRFFPRLFLFIKIGCFWCH